MAKPSLIPPPIVPKGEFTRYRILSKDSRDPLGSMTQRVSRVSEDGKECYRLDITSESRDGDVIEESFVLQIVDVLKPLSYRVNIKNRKGEVTVESEMTCSELQLPPNSAHISATDFCLRGVAFTPKRKVAFNTITSEGTVVRMNGGVSSKKEKVKVPAGEFQCSKIDLTPDMTSLMEATGVNVPLPGLGALMKQFTSTFHYWFSVDEPHYLIKHESFIIDPIQGKQVILELTNVEDAGRQETSA